MYSREDGFMCGGSPLNSLDIILLKTVKPHFVSGRIHRRGDLFYTLVLPSVIGFVFLVLFFVQLHVGEIHRVALNIVLSFSPL